MQYSLLAPTSVDCTIKLPASKSISNRVLIINALSYSGLPIENLAESDDTRVLVQALNSSENVFDVGPAGTSMRFLTAFLSKIFGEWVVTGSERMKNRPIKVLVDALTELGAKIEYVEKEGYPPLRIFGCALYGKTLKLQGNISSQYISALLMIGPMVQNGLTIELEGEVISKPYIEMTLSLMRYFGIESEWNGARITIPQQNYAVKPFYVESDWSAASYWYSIAALLPGSKVILPDLFGESTQGDSKVASLFAEIGVESAYGSSQVTITSREVHLNRFAYDFTNQPDLAQTFAVCLALKHIPFRLEGLQSLRIKETDRIAALIAELRKLGYLLEETRPGVLEWKGEKIAVEPSICIDTYEDHRMAMAFAPAAVMFPDIKIAEPKVVSKSYPGFWNDLELAGFTIKK